MGKTEENEEINEGRTKLKVSREGKKRERRSATGKKAAGMVCAACNGRAAQNAAGVIQVATCSTETGTLVSLDVNRNTKALHYSSQDVFF